MMKYRVIIIGGGCIGAACLYELAKRGVTDILLLEKQTYGNASTGKSAGIVESNYLDKEDILNTLRSMPVFKEFKEKFDLPYITNGYLRIARENEDMERFAEAAKLQQELGANGRVVIPDEVKSLLPEIDISKIKGGLYDPDAAFIDPYILTSIFIEQARELGAYAKQNTEVLDIKVSNGEVSSVVTDKGEFECEIIINAAGAWGEKIGNMVGAYLPMKAFRRQIVVLDAPGIDHTVPSVMDYIPGKENSGIYFREEVGGKIFAGLHYESFSDTEKDVDPDKYNQHVDSDYIHQISEKLLEIAPGFTDLGYQGGWAGFYPFTPDAKPIVGELEKIKGFYNCLGFAGHGVQVSPVFGQVMADLILDGATDKIDDIERYSAERFSKEAPIF